MENYSPSIPGKPFSSSTPQKLATEIKGEVAGVAARASHAAQEVSSEASSTFDDLKVAVQEAIEDYAAKGKKQLSRTAERIGAYADNNTALVVGGAVVIGLLLGHILTRRSD